MKKVWEWLKEKYQWFKKQKKMLVTLVAVIILILCAIIYYQRNRIDSLKEDKENTSQVLDALQDTVKIYQNKEKEWVAEKLTIQISMKELQKINGLLNETQKEMFERIKKIEDGNKVIAAAVIKTNVKLDSLIAGGEVAIDTTEKTITFSDSTKNIQYDIRANNVLPAYPDVKPTLMFQKFSLPNSQFIEFHYKDDKKKDFPISFSVTNTNDYFKTINVESYAIPGIEYKTGWDKFGNWMKQNAKPLIYIGVGIVGGATAVAIWGK